MIFCKVDCILQANDGYQSFLVFVPMPSSLELDSSKKVTHWILTGISSEEIKTFDTNLEPTVSNLANGIIILKFNDFILMRKNVP